MFSILMTSLTDKPLILQWEVWLRSLLGLKGLNVILLSLWRFDLSRFWMPFWVSRLGIPWWSNNFGNACSCTCVATLLDSTDELQGFSSSCEQKYSFKDNQRLRRANSFVQTTKLWQKCDYLWRIYIYLIFICCSWQIAIRLPRGQRLIPFPYVTSAICANAATSVYADFW